MDDVERPDVAKPKFSGQRKSSEIKKYKYSTKVWLIKNKKGPYTKTNNESFNLLTYFQIVWFLKKFYVLNSVMLFKTCTR